MRAIQLKKPKHFERIEINEPEKPAPGEALVRVHRVGICGTDASGYLGKMPFFSYPRIPGHELGVEVLETGEGVSNVKPGDKCSVEPYLNDPQSFASRAGNPNCCERLQVLGVHIDGGLRLRFVLPARKLHPSASLSYDQLALVETLAIGCHAVDRGRARAGEHALVIGAGPIGLSVIEFLRVAGASIAVFDINEKRLKFCERAMGIDRTILFKGDGSEMSRMNDITEGNLFPLVLDATGDHKSMSNALNYCAPGGRLVYVGVTSHEISFPHALMHRKELTLLATRNALPRDFRRIIEIINDGEINTSNWVTHRTRFENFIRDFPTLINPETGVVKAVVEVA